MTETSSPMIRFTSLMSSIADPWCGELTAALTASTQRTVDFIDGSDRERKHLMRTGAIDLAWVCGLLHVGRERQSQWPYHVVAAPVMRADRYRDEPVYFGDVVVRSDNPATTIDDAIKGVWVYNERTSFSGFHMACHNLGIDPGRRSVPSGSHLDSVRMVIAGDADWAVIDSTVLDMAAAIGDETREALRVIGSIGPHPMPPFIARNDLGAGTIGELVGALTAMHETPEGRRLFDRYGVARIVSVSEVDYDPIRHTGITVA